MIDGGSERRKVWKGEKLESMGKEVKSEIRRVQALFYERQRAQYLGPPAEGRGSP